jgi:FkbM family methyltransferase
MNSVVKRVALALLPPILVDVARWFRGGDHSAGISRKYWGLHDLDHQIEKYLNFDNGFYVELGANDGLLASNTFYYEKYRNWRGVLIEPAPNLFLKCRTNRSHRNTVICAACVSHDYKDEFVKIIYSDSMSVPVNLESDIGDNVEHAELGRQFLRPGETVFTFGAIARPLDDIMTEAKAPRLIDFLSLDVEGAEIEVLKGVDHSAFSFRYMLIECRDIAKLQNYLMPLGYRLLEKFNEHDYLFGRSGQSDLLLSTDGVFV